jgi:hypothetical protein
VRSLLASLVILLIVSCHGGSSSPTAPPLNTAALTGKVTNVNTTVPLERAEVRVTQFGQTVSTLTSSQGNYSFFTGLLPGGVSITVTASGYTAATGTTTLVAGSNRYDVQLRPAP